MRSLSINECLTEFVERAYADASIPIDDAVLVRGMIALASSGGSNRRRMIEMAAATLNSLEPAQREAVLRDVVVPSEVLRMLGTDVTMPAPLQIVDRLMGLSEEQVASWRAAMIRSISHHAEGQAARVITMGIRKQHAYREKADEARRFLRSPRVDPRPEDWPYLQADVDAGAAPDLKAAAEVIVATADAWRTLNAEIERESRLGAQAIAEAPADEIEGAAQAARDAITGLVDDFLARAG